MVGAGGRLGTGGQKGKNWDNCNRITITNLKKDSWAKRGQNDINEEKTWKKRQWNTVMDGEIY